MPHCEEDKIPDTCRRCEKHKEPACSECFAFTREEILRALTKKYPTRYERERHIFTTEIRKVVDNDYILAYLHKKSDNTLTLKYSVKLGLKNQRYSSLMLLSEQQIPALLQIIKIYEEIIYLQKQGVL